MKLEVVARLVVAITLLTYNVYVEDILQPFPIVCSGYIDIFQYGSCRHIELSFK